MEADLKTTGDIAKQIGATRQSVDYAIQRYRVQETQRAGIVRLYDNPAVEAVKRAVQRTTGRMKGVSSA
jgi:hypothetical protein